MVTKANTTRQGDLIRLYQHKFNKDGRIQDDTVYLRVIHIKRKMAQANTSEELDFSNSL